MTYCSPPAPLWRGFSGRVATFPWKTPTELRLAYDRSARSRKAERVDEPAGFLPLRFSGRPPSRHLGINRKWKLTRSPAFLLRES